MSRLSEVVRRIVEQGDLTQEIPAGGRDEIGQLSGYFKEMVARLRTVPLQLGENARQLEAAVGELEAAMESQSRTVTRQATALQETQVTAEEIRQTSASASRSAEGVLAQAQGAAALGLSGATAVVESQAMLEGLRQASQDVAVRIQALESRSRQIGDITDAVKDLADQSNMLALNAAIEAVRAGEHGKGFSLVAREIRRLADQSVQATGRVREILEGVQEATREAVRISEASSAQVGAGLSQMKSSGESLKALAGMVQESSASVRQIATAVGQQNTGISQIFTAVVDQNKMMEESVKQVEGTTRSLASVKQVAGQLAGVVARYKV